MRTPDNPQTLTLRRCANQPACEEMVSGKRKYHSDKCRWERTAAYRKAISRLRQKHQPIESDEETLALFVRLAKSPTSPGERCDARWQDLHELDTLLSRHGPVPEMRFEIQSKASAIRHELLLSHPTTSDDVLQYIRCLAILVDVGAEKPWEVRRLRRYAWEVVQYYLRTRDYARLSKALITYAHNCRLDNHEYQARNFYTYPYHILRNYRSRGDINNRILLHNAMLWWLRFFVPELSCNEQDDFIKKLVVLTTEIGTPAAWLETHRELTGYFGSGGRYRDRALDHHRQLNELLRSNSFPEYGLAALLRPKIHTLLDSGIPADRDKALQLIAGKFLNLYRKDPHFYYHELLVTWRNELNLSFILPEPVYGSAILTYLPRN